MEKKQEVSKEDLNTLCLKELNLPLDKLIEIVPKLGALYQILKGPIYIERFNGLLKSTQKEDPLDCAYIKLCVIDLLKNKEEFQRFVEILKLLAEDL